MREVKKLYYWGVFITILFFLFIQIYYHFFPSSTIEKNSIAFSKIESRDIKSIVKRLTDSHNRRATYLVYGEDSICIDHYWEEKINIGDSIIKPKGSLKLIIKNSIGVVDTLDYGENEWVILTYNF